MKPAPPPSGNPFRANPVLRTESPVEGRSRRSPLAASVALHVLLIAVFLVLPGPFLEKHEPEPVEIVFYSPDELDRPVELPPEVPEPAPEPQPEPVEIAEAKPVEPPPERLRPELPARPVERVVRQEPAAKTEVEPKPRPVAPEAAKPRPTVRTNLFETETASEPTMVASRRQTRTGGFGEDSTETPVGRKNTRVIASGSFSDGAMAVPREGAPARRGGTVVRTSFADETDDEPAPTRAVGEVSQGGFEDGATPARQPATRKRSAEVADLDSPVEIVSKPRPLYTEQARDLRIEGEVVLEVTFVATGRLRVLRVLGSLGHGLDEAAVEAAKKIEFTPARRNGRPVDHTATLRVVFRLA